MKMYLGKQLAILCILKFFAFVKSVEAGPTSISRISTIEIVGSRLFVSDTGDQFFIKGIAYQPSRSTAEAYDNPEFRDTRYVDPLADSKTCLRDIPYLKKLNINTIRVYSVDPNKSHDICMQALADAGIYLLLDLAEPDTSIARDNPTWDVNIWKRYKAVVDSMHIYPNLIGFFAGNEVTNDNTNTDASPFVKAAIRDVKQYIKTKEYRKIPVGYSTNDDADTRSALAKYFSCDEKLSVDFYGINMYEWCGYSSYGTSGYKERTEEFEDYPVPVFFSEFGCNLLRPRPFTEVSALYGQKMSKVWSGGLAYMYFEEENNYGVVRINNRGGVEELEDFRNLMQEFERADPKGIKKAEYLTLLTSRPIVECPETSDGSQWRASLQVPHTPNIEKCQCLEKCLPCLVMPFENTLQLQEHFDYICDRADCSDILANGEEGIYGEFSDCTPEQKLALEISKLYAKQEETSQHCPLEGKQVYYNFNFETDVSSKNKCTMLINDALYPEAGPGSQFGQKVGLEKETSARPDLIQGSGSASQFSNSGFAILFVTIFMASFLL